MLVLTFLLVVVETEGKKLAPETENTVCTTKSSTEA